MRFIPNRSSPAPPRSAASSRISPVRRTAWSGSTPHPTAPASAPPTSPAGPISCSTATVPAEFTESGVDRPSASAQTFSVTNTGGGGMMLDVDGSGVLTTASTIDADTLDGTDGADFATDVEAAALVAAHAASADHDGRYYTETELNTSGAGGAVHWDNLAASLPGFADGVDDDTTYSVGPGLIIRQRPDPDRLGSLLQTRTSTLDSVGTSDHLHRHRRRRSRPHQLLRHQRRPQGGPLRRHRLLQRHHQPPSTARATSAGTPPSPSAPTASASSATTTSPTATSRWPTATTPPAPAPPPPPSTARATSAGTPPSPSAPTASASSATTTPPTSTSRWPTATTPPAPAPPPPPSTAWVDVGGYTSIAIGADGLGLISFALTTGTFTAHCEDVLCSSAYISLQEGTSVVGRTSMVIGADGLGLFSYCDDGFNVLKTAHCGDTSCTGSNWYLHEFDCLDTSMAISPGDGLGTIYFSGPSGLRAAHCFDVGCTWSPTATELVCPGSQPSVAIGVDGLPLVVCSGLAVVHLPFGF